MKNAVILYLLILLWWSGVYYQFRQLCRQRGTACAATFIFRILLHNYLFVAGMEERKNRQLIKMALLVKTGELLGLVLLLRIFWLTSLGEIVIVLLCLGAFGAAFAYLLSLGKGSNQEIQCVYALSGEYGVYEIVLNSSGAVREWIGTTLAELDLRRKELLVLSISRAGKAIIFPKGPEVLLADDRLLVFGKNATLPAEPLCEKD